MVRVHGEIKKFQMRVPAHIYANEYILGRIQQDRTLDQISNVACLPGIEKQGMMRGLNFDQFPQRLQIDPVPVCSVLSLRGFKYFRYVEKPLIVHEIAEGIDTDHSLTDDLMPVHL